MLHELELECELEFCMRMRASAVWFRHQEFAAASRISGSLSARCEPEHVSSVVLNGSIGLPVMPKK